MIRSLYRDFIHIIKIQEKQPITKTKKSRLLPKDKMQQIRDEFRKPILNETSGTSNSCDTIESRYQNGLNRFSVLRMNTSFYKPRSHNQASISNPGSDTAANFFMYKNGQRHPLNSVQVQFDGTLRNYERGHVVSPYDGKNVVSPYDRKKLDFDAHSPDLDSQMRHWRRDRLTKGVPISSDEIERV
jgi:hypothetical protein